MKLLDGVDTLGGLLEIVRRVHGEKVALVVDDATLTYAELDLRSTQAAHALERDAMGAGDRIAVLGKGSLSSVSLMFGAAKARAIYVPINSRLAPKEIAYILAHAEPKLLMVDAECLDLLPRIAAEAGQLPKLLATVPNGVGLEVFDEWLEGTPSSMPSRSYAAEDAVVTLYTSGTTGHPKGVRLSSRSLLGVAQALRAAGDPWFGWNDRTVSMVSQPAFHIGGVWWLVQGLSQGSTNVLLRGFDAKQVLRIIPKYRVATTCMAPAMIQLLLLEPGCREVDFSSLRAINYGGSTCPTALLREAMEVFGCGFCNAYGSTETGNVVVSLRPEEHLEASDQRLRAVGKPMPGVEVRILDENWEDVGTGATGHIAVRSPSNMIDYWKNDEATRSTLVDGWLMTGDAGFRDEEGYIHVSDRIRDMIISAGEKIFPAEVENVIRTHPGVEDVAVIGVPDPLWGEAVRALVVVAAGTAGTALRPGDIIRYVRGRVGEYKVPRAVEFVESLPRNAAGKILKRELREPYWRGQDRRI
ncbi:long-chain-fatty-acid--CoA ligase [Pendulispora brunnea]|uniref:Long-chain-fatty-acid--CoA ligase n=1 Tax=Pendulispora brunnea TaxID=2905690 RepID=A0ABZ2JYR4_9BACT